MINTLLLLACIIALVGLIKSVKETINNAKELKKWL